MLAIKVTPPILVGVDSGYSGSPGLSYWWRTTGETKTSCELQVILHVMFSILARICDHILASKRMNTSTLEWIGFRRKSAGNQVFSMKYGLYQLYISVSHPHFPCEATISPQKDTNFPDGSWQVAINHPWPSAP